MRISRGSPGSSEGGCRLSSFAPGGYLTLSMGGGSLPNVKLSPAEQAAARSKIAQKMFETMQAPSLGSVRKPFSQPVLDWANGKGRNPSWSTKWSAHYVEELHAIQRLGCIFYLSLPLCLFYLKQVSAATHVFGKDERKMINDSYGGMYSSWFSMHKENPSGLGPGTQAIDPNARKRYKVEREAFFFKKSILKPEATVAPWSNLRKEDMAKYGWGWDDKLTAEHADAQKMLNELEEAKKVGGATGRDEWVAHYKKRFEKKLPLPRQWWGVFASLDARIFSLHPRRHPVLMMEDEMPWYSHTFRPNMDIDHIREMSIHPYEEYYHALHHLDGGSGGHH